MIRKLYKILKEILCWGGGILMAAGFGIYAYAFLIYGFYPYSIPFILAYLVLAPLFPVLYLIFKKRILKKISFGLFFLPPLIFLLFYIALATGKIHLC